MPDAVRIVECPDLLRCLLPFDQDAHVFRQRREFSGSQSGALLHRRMQDAGSFRPVAEAEFLDQRKRRIEFRARACRELLANPPLRIIEQGTD